MQGGGSPGQRPKGWERAGGVVSTGGCWRGGAAGRADRVQETSPGTGPCCLRPLWLLNQAGQRPHLRALLEEYPHRIQAVYPCPRASPSAASASRDSWVTLPLHLLLPCYFPVQELRVKGWTPGPRCLLPRLSLTKAPLQPSSP